MTMELEMGGSFIHSNLTQYGLQIVMALNRRMQSEKIDETKLEQEQEIDEAFVLYDIENTI